MGCTKIHVEDLLSTMLLMRAGATIAIGNISISGNDLEEIHAVHRIDLDAVYDDTAPTFIIGYYGGYASAKLFVYDTENYSFDENANRLAEILKDEDLYDFGYTYIESDDLIKTVC